MIHDAASFDSLAGQARSQELETRLARHSEGAAEGTLEATELRKAAKEFEQMVYGMMMKSMRQAMPSDGFLGKSYGEDVFTSMLDGEYVKNLSIGGEQGLAEMIYRQFVDLGMLRDGCSEKTQLPCRGRVSSEFGPRVDPLDGSDRHHDGMDLAVPAGTPIRAALSGRVVFAGEREGYGRMIIVEHGDDVRTVYAHNKENFVGKGDEVQQGQVLGTVGSSGRSTGPHLHFEVRRADAPVDPRTVLGMQVTVQR